jgi:hypothetical protein
VTTNRPKRLFLSYATEDEQYREQFDQALAGVRRAGLVTMWTFREIAPGADLDHAITTSIEQADIIALLVSPAFLASDYCWNVEMKRAIELYDVGKTALVPIVVRSCVWEDAPFARLNALPKDARPVAEWPSRDEAWTSVVRGVRRLIEDSNRGVKRTEPILAPRISRGLQRDDNGFLTKEAVLHMVLSRVQGNQQPLAEPLLLLENSFQRTWLVFTERIIACVLDDISKNELYDPLRWECRHRHALPVQVERYKNKVGVIHLGPDHPDWLYSIRLHPDPAHLKAEIEFLLSGATRN